jgi:hypothetical protein
MGQIMALLVLAKALPCASGSLALERIQEMIAVGGNWRYTAVAGKEKWKSRLSLPTVHEGRKPLKTSCEKLLSKFAGIFCVWRRIVL